MKSLMVSLGVIASFLMSILASWVYDILKENGILPTSSDPIKYAVGGIVFTATIYLSVLSQHHNVRKTDPQMSWQEFFDRIGVFLQKVLFGFGASAITLTLLNLMLFKYFSSEFSKAMNSAAISQEQYIIYYTVYLPLTQLGGTILCLIGGQIGVFTKLFNDKLYNYEEIRPSDERNNIMAIPYHIRLDLIKGAFLNAVFWYILGASILGQILIATWDIYNNIP
jgi:hypothetical protein